MLMPLILVASITWVSEKHQCLTECHAPEVVEHQHSCCEMPNHATESKSTIKTGCCDKNEVSCIDKGCCVDEKLVVDKTINELENIQKENRSSIFNFLFAPLTQSIEKTVSLPDSAKNTKCKSIEKGQKGQVSHYILFQNFRC